ncbi:MAG: hypothetical protein AAF982_06080 [Pseudomonadota bacterium]
MSHGVRALSSARKALPSKTVDLADDLRGLLKILGIRLPRTVQYGGFDGVVRPMIEMEEALAHAMLAPFDARPVSVSTGPGAGPEGQTRGQSG